MIFSFDIYFVVDFIGRNVLIMMSFGFSYVSFALL